MVRKVVFLLASARVRWFAVLAWVVAFAAVHPTSATAAVLTVPGDYATIQSAIDAAAEGDEVVVSPGRYVENIQFNNKNIVLRSTDPTSPTVVGETIIDGNHEGAVVEFQGDEVTTCRLAGFRITNGTRDTAYPRWSISAIAGNSCLATVDHNQVTTNSCQGIAYCRGLIQANTVAYNQGAGINWCNGRIEGNSIYNNLALENYDSGGGVSDCNGEIIGNLIYHNRASSVYAGGGGLGSCEGLIENNTIVGNHSSTGNALNNCYGTIRNCIMWGDSPQDGLQFYENSPPVACCIQGWTNTEEGCFSLDPLFRDPAANDYHLLPESPCIDAGEAIDAGIEDIDGQAFSFDVYALNGQGSDVDIGADEYVGPPGGALPPAAPANLNPNATWESAWVQPLLTCGAFVNPGIPSYHLSTQWQVATDSGFSSLVFDSGWGHTNWTSLPLPVRLEPGTRYFWRVRFLNGSRLWSDWAEADFTTRDQPVVYVPQDYSSIQGAIDAALDGDEVVVSPGRYLENIHFNNTDIVLRSTDPTSPTVVSQTILDGNGAGPVVTFGGQEGPACVLTGFTITHGVNNQFGGGIVGTGCSATIRGNVILNNQAQFGGGIAGCNGLIQSNLITFNSASGDGGGVSNFPNSAVVLDKNRISYNTAGEDGGGICGGHVVHNNWVYRNQANGWGGGFNPVANSDCVLENNTFVANSATYAGGIKMYHDKVTNCILWGNTASDSDPQLSIGDRYAQGPVACVIEGWPDRENGNLDINPQFADAAHDDFHLLSDSPCIDAGTTPTSLVADIDGEPRLFDATPYNLQGSDVDIGADEFQSEEVPGPPPAPPRNLWPGPTTADSWIEPLLKCGGYVEPSPNDGHLATQWQVSLQPDFTTVLYDSGRDAAHPESLQVPLNLGRGRTFFWRARFISGSRAIGQWAATSTTTVRWSQILVPGDFPSIQAALDAAPEGGEIRVNEGTYREHIEFPGRNVVLRSRDPGDWEVIKHTIIDGGGGGTIVKFQGTEGPSCILEGFTITDGGNDPSLPGIVGGGIRGFGTHATIRRNWVRDNVVHAFACGYPDGCQNDYGMVYSAQGSGILSCSGLIEGNVISGNKGIDDESIAWAPGDGFHSPNVVGIHAYACGAGIYNCSGPIYNNTLYGNDYAIMNSSGPVRNTIIWDTGNKQYNLNSVPSFCCIQDYPTTSGINISLDPKFVDPANGDFHLQPDSPCIDAGGNVQGVPLDFDGDVRPQFALQEQRGDGSGFDIGADEFHSPLALPFDRILDRILGRPLPPYIGGNLNGDGVVDIGDWITYLQGAAGP